MLSSIFFAICLASFASFFSSVFVVFHTPAGSVSRLLLVMKIASVATWLVGLSAIARSPAVLSFATMAALCGQAGAVLLFWYAAREAMPYSLSVAFVPASPKGLISAGPFRWLLHPFYSAYVLSYWSVFVFTLHWATACAAVFMHVLYTVSAAREERLLNRTFGEEYVRAKRGRISPFPVLRDPASIRAVAFVAAIVLVLIVTARALPANGTLLSDAALEAAVRSITSAD